MQLIERDTIYIFGYVVETTSAQNNKIISELYNTFFESDKEATLLSLKGSKRGYFGLMWYTQGHEKYCYLLGIEADKENTLPTGAQLKTISKAIYAVAHYPYDKDIIEAWNEFFYITIPGEGYLPNEEQNLYFEFYPKSVHGNYELWVPVVKSNV